ncbi:hypothetical protein T492DRAFT_841794 [Pavlovales sp. CCMP2436]|nr:hypothetical protein T492DRAFT_841794 [Pavlovales sp. CCMP2436]
MQLPSTFELSRVGSPVSLTVVLNHFKRRTLCAQIEALPAQTAVPSHIWLVLFGSPIVHKLEQVARSYNDLRTTISVVESDLNLKYYGRMQVAVRAPTDFVLIIDDDMIPGAKFVEQMVRTAHTREYERALLGSIGWILPRPGADGRFGSYSACQVDHHLVEHLGRVARAAERRLSEPQVEHVQRALVVGARARRRADGRHERLAHVRRRGQRHERPPREAAARARHQPAVERAQRRRVRLGGHEEQRLLPRGALAQRARRAAAAEAQPPRAVARARAC